MSKIKPNLKQKKCKASKKEAILSSLESRQDFSVGKRPLLYRFVFSSRFSLCVVLLLMISFSLQNTERVFANENVESEVINKTTESSIYENEIQINNEPVFEESSEQEVAILSEEDTLVPQEIESSDIQDSSENYSTELQYDSNELYSSSTSSVSDQILTEDDLVSSSTEFIEEDIEVVDTSVENEQSTETDTDNESDSEVINNVSSSSNNDTANSSSTEDNFAEEATTTDEILEELLEQQTTLETVSVVQSDSEFSFSKDECTQLSTGSFYCMQPQENNLNDALFSAPDEDGDLEIFLIREGVQTQVTENLVDDAAPYYDQNSNTVVWHRLVNDVYQIISYDPDSREEIQITQTAENNMEPTRQGDLTVWQRWVDNGWNIVLYDGESETQITNNNHHNVAPYIHGTLIVWNSRDQSGEKTIEMFDIKSGTYVTVDDPDGVSVSNPRMVFVYDSLHPNGDIVTKGYDVLAKKFIDLDSLPRELPEELPPSDSTGETRALIQAKPNIKSETEESISSSTPNVLPPVPLDTSSSTDSMTLDLSNNTSTTTDLSQDETLLPSEFDIVIEPFTNTESTSTNSVQE